jgi:diacylglycerol kinase (ATP)
MRVSLVHNAKAGDSGQRRRDIEAALEEFGYDVHRTVRKKDDWEPLLEDPGELVVVAGGDGTVGAVARRMIRREVPIAVLPLGTANNVARTLGAQGSVREVIASWTSAQTLDLDLGIASGSWGKSWFVEGFGLGLLATCMAMLQEQDKKSSVKKEGQAFKLFRDRLAVGGLAADYPPLALSGTLDDQDVSGEYLLMHAMNIRSLGPGLELAPQANPGDGMLDFVFLPAERRAAFMDYLAALREDRHAPPPVVVRRGRRLRLEGNGYDAHIDDRLLRTEPAPPGAHLDIEVSVDAQAVRMLVPMGIPGMEVVPPELMGVPRVPLDA